MGQLNIGNTNELKQFKNKYNKAVRDNKDIFIFKGQQILVTYAKYLLEYVDNIQGGHHGKH